LALAGLTALLAFAAPGSRTALAAPPNAQDFRIVYYITDEQGNRGRQMSELDMQQFVNQARCECEQDIIMRITYQGQGVDAEQLLLMIGQFCGIAQSAPGIGTYPLCAQIASGLPQTFQTTAEFSFAPLWLAQGVKGGNQNINDPEVEPSGGCSAQAAQGGLWMCAGLTDCQMGNFFMQGATNLNTEGGTPSGILFDFQPPVSAPSDFSASSGDSAVQISWKNLAPGDLAGYRVLCADADGNPVKSAFSLQRPTPSTIVNGTIYYTKGNLCPGGSFGPGYTPGAGDTGDGETGETGDTGETGETGDADAGDTADTGDVCMDGDVGCPCIDGTTCNDSLTCDNGVCVSDNPDCEPGTPGCVCTADGLCNDPLVCSNDVCSLPSTGIESLNWDYVCSGHLGFNTTSARITGLENGKDYTFLVVAYDKAGNPTFGDTITARPVPTNGLWEQCESQGDICGDGWNCSVTDQPGKLGLLFGTLGLLGLGGGLLVRRRRRRA